MVVIFQQCGFQDCKFLKMTTQLKFLFPPPPVDMAQWVKCLLPKHGDLSWHPLNLCKMWLWQCGPVTPEQGEGLARDRCTQGSSASFEVEKSKVWLFEVILRLSHLTHWIGSLHDGEA